MRPSLRSAWPLILPALVLLGAAFVAPLINMIKMSFDTHTPGYIGVGPEFAFTLDNYTALPSFAISFVTTFRLAAVSSAITVGLAWPCAYFIARHRPGYLRTTLLGFLIAMMFLNIIVRLYGINLTFVSTPALHGFLDEIGIPFYSSRFSEILVIIGLVHFTIPIVVLTLVSAIQNIDPRLEESAQVLGAPRWRAVWLITVRLSSRGLVSAFLISFTLGVAAFVIPLVLGRGTVLFVSNLVWNRFSQIADYPSASALAVALLIIALLMLTAISRFARPRWER